jgi:hypothetical protein
MPWCEPCARYFAPSAMSSEGQCPQCGRTLDSTQLATRVSADSLDLKKMAGLEDEKLPWHFKLLVFLLVTYLGWRVVDLFV